MSPSSLADDFIVAMLVYDLSTRKKVHPATRVRQAAIARDAGAVQAAPE
jgi:hypothetical protein